MAESDASEQGTFRARLQLFAWLMFGQSVAFDLLGALQSVAGGSTTWIEILTTRRELGGNVVLLLLALVIRYARLSGFWLKLMDPLVLWCTVAPTVLVAMESTDATSQPGMADSMVTMAIVIVRAALIPSTAVVTLSITAVAATPGLIVAGIFPMTHPTSTGSLGNTLYIGGSITSVQGQARTNLAALDATTAAVLEWSPGVNRFPYALAFAGEAVFVGGDLI